MAFDQDGNDPTTTFSTTYTFYAVADLANAPQDTNVEAKWTAVNATDTEPNLEFQTRTLDIAEESFSGTIYFKLSSDEGWPTGQYKFDLYLNGTQAQGRSSAFSRTCYFECGPIRSDSFCLQFNCRQNCIYDNNTCPQYSHLSIPSSSVPPQFGHWMVSTLMG